MNILSNITKENKQVVTLYISTVFGILFGILSSVINTRFLDPAEYGNVRYIQNIINFIASLLLFGFFLSGSRLLAISRCEQRSKKIRGVLIIILCVASVLLVLSMIVCFLLHQTSSIAYLFLISIPVCIYPLLSNYVQTTAQGDNHIYRLSLSQFLPSLIYIPVAYIIYNFYGASSIKMILLQWGIYSIIYIIIIASTKPSFSELSPIWEELKQENSKYGIQLYVGSLVMVATSYLAGITIGIFNENNSEVGFYTLALTVTSPLKTLPAIIGTTYFKKFALQDKIPSNVFKYTLLLTAISCLCFLIIIKPLVIFLYSNTYIVVAKYASWLSVGFCIHGIGDMINRYLGSHGQGKSIRNSSIYNGLFKVFGFTILVYLWGTNGALITNIICSLIYCGTLVYYYLRFISNK